ncbi:MAG: hypothetical protein ACLPND_16210 [Candidatus Korobacteraceae bacterium]
MQTPDQHVSGNPEMVVLPAPTAWPFLLALGASLIFAGLLTNASVSILGAILFIPAAVGWFRQVLPHEHHLEVAAVPERELVVVASREVMRVPAAQHVQRAWLPLKVYPVSAGVKGGLAGGVAMALLAMLYGLIFYRSIWYPINLIAGSLYDSPSIPTTQEMAHFHLAWFVFALAMHATMCLLVGLLYGAMLPMLPRRPIILGGIIGPLLWTGLLYRILDYVNPLLDREINWWWFAASQVAFGVVAGLVVVRQNQEWTSENVPLAMRAGIEAPGLMHEHEGEGQKQ